MVSTRVRNDRERNSKILFKLFVDSFRLLVVTQHALISSHVGEDQISLEQKRSPRSRKPVVGFLVARLCWQVSPAYKNCRLP
jgi:hypothetical protein